MKNGIDFFPFIKNRLIKPSSVEDELSLILLLTDDVVVLDVDIPSEINCDKMFGGTIFYVIRGVNGNPCFLSSFKLTSVRSINSHPEQWCIIDFKRYGSFQKDANSNISTMEWSHPVDGKQAFNEFWRLTPDDEGYMK